MSDKNFNEFNHLWNDMPKEERSRLMPHAMEKHLLHIEQCKTKAIRHHKAYMRELDEISNNIRSGLEDYRPS